MSKIRINELARELEVKPNIILDMLPELGVEDKKTHSSSLDDDVALAIRRRLAAEAVSGEHEPAVPRASTSEAPRPSPDAVHETPVHARTVVHHPPAPVNEFDRVSSVLEGSA